MGVFNFQMFSMKVGSANSSSAEAYLKENDPKFWQHVKKFSVPDTTSGMRMLRLNLLYILYISICILKISYKTNFDYKIRNKFLLKVDNYFDE